MQYQAGFVVEIGPSGARIEVESGTVCGNCGSGRGCGLGPLIALFRRPAYQLWVALDDAQKGSVAVGDSIRVSLSAAELIKISSVAYLVPVAGMLVGAWLVSVLLPQFGDASAVAGAGLGVLAGWAGLMAFDPPAPVLLKN